MSIVRIHVPLVESQILDSCSQNYVLPAGLKGPYPHPCMAAISLAAPSKGELIGFSCKVTVVDVLCLRNCFLHVPVS